MEELVQEFSMDRVAKNPAVFDIDKLNWINQHYMRQLDAEAFFEAAKPHMIAAGYMTGAEEGEKLAWLKRVVATAQEHVSYAAQIPACVEMYFNDEFDIELYTAYGDAYLAKRDYDKALEYYKKVEKLYSYRFDSPPDKYCLEGFYETYKGKGEYEKACRYAELMYEALNESYISQEQQYATYMVEKYQNEQNEEKISKLQERNRKLLYVVIIVCVLIAIFTLLLISIHNRTKKIELLNKNLKEIGDGAFCQCRSLREVEWHDSLRVIGTEAFLECKYLKTPVFDANVEIKKNAFKGCK